jgi:hypothetical protein
MLPDSQLKSVALTTSSFAVIVLCAFEPNLISICMAFLNIAGLIAILASRDSDSESKLPVLLRTIIILGFLGCVSNIFNQLDRSLLAFTTTMVCTLALAAFFIGVPILGFARSGAKPLRQSAVSSAVCLVLLLVVSLGADIGSLILDWEFRRNLAEYARVVEDIRDGEIPVKSVFDHINLRNIKRLPHRVINLFAARSHDGALVVEFLLPSMYPKGYVYMDLKDSTAQSVQNMRLRDYALQPIVDKWYRFSF